MFDWNDHDQVGDPIWGQFSENEDHIVPYAKGTEENTLFTLGDYSKKLGNEEASTVVRCTEQTVSGAKNDFSKCIPETTSNFSTNEELSAPRLDMDTWPDLPSLNAALGKVYDDENDHDSMSTELINDFSEAQNLNPVRGNVTGFCHPNDVIHKQDPSYLNNLCSFSTDGTVKLDGQSELFGNEHEDKESDSFFDCDWASIGDFDDLDRIFRNSDSIFGHEMIGNADEFLSPSTDLISSAAQSIPMPDIPASRDQSADKGSSFFQLDGHSSHKRKPLKEEKTADSTATAGERTEYRTYLNCENSGVHYQFSDNVSRPKRQLRSRKKAEERSQTKPSQNFNGSWYHNIDQSEQFASPKMHPSVMTHVQTFQTPAINQQKHFEDAELGGHLSSSSQYIFTGYGFPTCPLPPFPLLPHPHNEMNQKKHVDVGYGFNSDTLKHSNSLKKLPNCHSRPVTMTPQEKIGKLRRRQQMQAMLAIQQQQQQFGHQIAGTDKSVSQACSQKNLSQEAGTNTSTVEEGASNLPSSDMNMPIEQDEPMLIDDRPLGETIYNQLQDAMEKLDIRVRLCIRDSLFRLARSAMERQCASDRSSSNKSNRDEDEAPAYEETNNEERDAETDTNPIDRIVAHLLFHRPSESCPKPAKDEVLRSPISCNPASKQSLNTSGSISKEQAENFEEMEVQPSL